MEQYSIIPGALKQLRNRVFFRAAPIMILSVGVGLYISQLNADDYSMLLVSVPVIVLAVGFGLYKSWTTQKVYIKSYKLTFNEHEIIRSADNVPTITIHLFEVSEITKDGHGNLFVQGNHRSNLISIPYQIENYEHIRSQLEKIQPITGVSALTKYRTLFVVFILALMIAVFTMTNKIIVGISGTLLTAALIWSLYEVQTNKNVTEATKRTSWVRVFFILAVIYMTITKVFDITF